MDLRNLFMVLCLCAPKALCLCVNVCALPSHPLIKLLTTLLLLSSFLPPRMPLGNNDKDTRLLMKQCYSSTLGIMSPVLSVHCTCVYVWICTGILQWCSVFLVGGYAVELFTILLLVSLICNTAYLF